MEQSGGRRGRTSRWLTRFPRALPLAVFLIIALITLLSVIAIERSESTRAAAQLRTRAAVIGSALERRANSSAAYLRAGAALLATLDTIEPDRFRRFVSELRLDGNSQGAEGIGWAMVVYPDQVAAFDAMMAREAPIPGVRLNPQPAPGQPYAVPVTYLEPDSARNRRALGFDMYSEPARRQAMEAAEQSERPTASGKVVLKQEGTGSGAGFLIYMPVFEPAPGGGRRLRGFIYSPFNAQSFLDAALAREDIGNNSVRLYDGPPSAGSLLASTVGIPPREAQAVHEEVAIANSPWVVTIEAPTDHGLSITSLLTLMFGLLLGGLLMLLVRLLTAQAVEDESTLAWFEEQASIRNSLTRELNHRVKNTLANVLSIIALTRRRSKTLDEFADGLDARIRALSATHDLLTKSEWGSTPIRAVIEAELNPYSQASDHEVDLQGPDIALAPNDALSLGLAVHELATNAAKYGALSKAGGRLQVRWHPIAEGLVRLEWQESGGPPVPATRGRGFGTDLIERIVSRELNNPVKLEFNPDGVRCELTIPVRRPTQFTMRERRL